MGNNISSKKIAELAKQADMEPSEAFVSDIRKRIENEPNAELLAENRVSYEKIRFGKIIIAVAAAACMALIVGGLVFYSVSNTVSADDSYSFEECQEYVLNTDGYIENIKKEVSEEFMENLHHTNDMIANLERSMPYEGKYKATPAVREPYDLEDLEDDEYSIYYGLSDVEKYPDYFGGTYLNTDGKLVVQIKDTYFEKKYRKCDWYKELAKMYGSEDFACTPVKYNYIELSDEMYDFLCNIRFELRDAGVGVVRVGVNYYRNNICVWVRTEEDKINAEKFLNNDIYSVIVAEEWITEPQPSCFPTMSGRSTA